MSGVSRIIAGAILLTIVTIQFGGYFMTKIVRGQVPMTDFQKSFARAGHAHAGVLVTLSLVVQLFADATALTEPWSVLARSGIPAAAILMPVGFFAASSGAGRTSPSRLVAIVYVGAVFLALGAITLGIGLLLAPAR
jgi:hypothetical protein